MTVDFEKSVKLAGRWGLLGLGMFTSASGIACVAQAQLGTTPISSTPYVLAAITGLTFGQTTFWVNVFFVFMQWVLLRKLFASAAQWATASGWWAQMLMSLTGNVILAVGIVMQVESKTLVQPGEGMVLASSVRFKKSFGNMKIVNDVLLVLLALVLGFAFLGGPVGVREGTLVSAVMVGLCVKGWYRLLNGVRKRLSA